MTEKKEKQNKNKWQMITGFDKYLDIIKFSN
jgi:hypothetical protein